MLAPRLPRPMVPLMPIRQKWHSSTMPCIHSLFSDVIVSINDTIVEGGEQTYSMKALIGTLFSYSKDTMDNQLFSSGFVRDDAGKADDMANTGHVSRRGWTNWELSKIFTENFFCF